MKGTNVKKYYIEVILWEDHTRIDGGPLPEDPDNYVLPTLSVGIVVKETDKTLLLVTDIEKFNDQSSNVTYTILFKSSIISRKQYGRIELSDID